MIEWLKLEMSLYSKKYDINEILIFMEGDFVGGFEFLADSELMELNNLLKLVKNNKLKIEEFYMAITTYCMINTDGKLKPDIINEVVTKIGNQTGSNGREAFAYATAV